VIDLHSHILPGLDDGPDDFEGALAMARAAVAAGTTTMACTPHIDYLQGVDPLEVPYAVADLDLDLAASGVELELVPGGEVALNRLPELSDDELAAVCLGDGRWILLECPLDPVGGPLEEAVFMLQSRGFHVLLAHPERSPAFLRRPDRVRNLVAQGALTSITAGALAGRFGRPPRDLAVRLLEEGVVHSVASDTHDALRRPPDLLGGLAAGEQLLKGLDRLADWLTEDVPGAVVTGAAPPPAPDVALRRPLRSRFGRGR
jgi:protein-tyrosine phosphatase